jgi:hypothetical protein
MAAAGMTGYIIGDQAGRAIIPKGSMEGVAEGDMKLSVTELKDIERVTKERNRVSGRIDGIFDEDVEGRMVSANAKIAKNPHLKFLDAFNKKEGGKHPKLANFVENYEKQQKLIAARKIRDRIFDKNGNLKEGSREAIKKIAVDEMSTKRGVIRSVPGKSTAYNSLWEGSTRGKYGVGLKNKELPKHLRNYMEQNTRRSRELGGGPGSQIDIYKERVKLALSQYVENETGVKLGGRSWDGSEVSLDSEINRLGGASFRGTMGQIGGGGRGGYYLGEGGYSDLQGGGTGDIGMTPLQVRKQVEDRILEEGRGMRGYTLRNQLLLDSTTHRVSRRKPTPYDRWVRRPEVQATLRRRRLEKRQDNLDRGAMNAHKRKYGDWAPEMKDGKSFHKDFSDERKY